MDDNVVRLCVQGRKIEPGMNAQLYTLRNVTRLPTRDRAKFLRTTGLKSGIAVSSVCAKHCEAQPETHRRTQIGRAHV